VLRRIGRFVYGVGFIVSGVAFFLLAQLLRRPTYQAPAVIVLEKDGESNPPN